MKIEQYYETFYPTQQLGSDLERVDRLRCLFAEMPKKKKVLSLGCGPGVDIAFLAEENEVHGVDLSLPALEHARGLSIIPHRADIEKPLDFPDGSFDIIIATDILEHLFDPKSVLREMRRLLRPGGTLIASVPNHFYWKMRLQILKGGDLVLPFHGDAKQWDYFHIRFFTPEGYEKLLESAGFSIAQRHYSRFRTLPRGLPRSVDEKLAHKFPGLFSLHFIVECS